MTTSELIQLLITKPTSEFEYGFNSAIIYMLKQEHRIDDLYRAMNENNVHFVIDYDTRKNIEESRMHGNKLSAVKYLKDATGLGLREAKEIMDSYFSYFKRVES